MAFDAQQGRVVRYRWWIVGAAALAFGAYAYARASRPIQIGVVAASAGPAERVLAITGRTRPQVTITLLPKAAGQLLRLTKEEGDAVTAGELLAQLDADAPQAAVERVESEIGAQRRAVAEAWRDFERAAALRERGLATLKEYEQAKFALDQSQAELERLAASRREASARLRDNTIIAPVSGIVLSRPVDPGQVVTAQSVIYEIAPLADVEVEADVDEQFLGEVREGLKADVLIAGAAQPVPATLYYISAKVDPRTGGAKVRLRLDRRVDGLRSGLTADVNLVIEKRDRAITVARSAVLGREAGARVQVVKQGIVEERKVSFLEWPSERVIVLSGLSDGEQIVAQPRAELLGQRVAPTTDLAMLRGARQPRGSEARRAL